MILASEVGDKTFFIAAVLAMKHSRAVVLVGALGALALMTVLSAILGDITKRIMPHEYTHYLAVLLFIVFGRHSGKSEPPFFFTCVATKYLAAKSIENKAELESKLSPEARCREVRS